jgi:hypothetical protein
MRNGSDAYKRSSIETEADVVVAGDGAGHPTVIGIVADETEVGAGVGQGHGLLNAVVLSSPKISRWMTI